MSLETFEPKRFDQPVGEILPEVSPDLDLEQAKEECRETVEKLSFDISGIGPKAAERYLLRFEYGFETTALLDHYGINKSTLSKQVNQVHRTVLNHPTLARTVGQFRSKRAGVKRPNTSDKRLWDGELNLHSKPIYTAINYFSGDVTTPYTWKVDLRADFALEDKTRRIRSSYLIDEEYGVLLKRILKGISYPDQSREFRYERLRNCHIYPLPHPEIEQGKGTLLDGLEHHAAYDIKRIFEDPAWGSIEKMISFVESDESIPRPLPEYALPETIIGKQVDSSQLQKYTRENHRRNNFEHILRAYPYTRIENIPLKTIDLLWDGSLKKDDDPLKRILRTSQPHYHPGQNRTIWALDNLN